MANLFRIFRPSGGQTVLAALLAVTFCLFLVVQQNWMSSAPTALNSSEEQQSRASESSVKPLAVVMAESRKPNRSEPSIAAPTSSSTISARPGPTDAVESPSESNGQSVFDDAVPATASDLQAMEDSIVAQVPGALASTVAIRAYSIQGSGVIVSDEGYVLTAAHVAVKPGQDLDIILSDKREVKGQTRYVDNLLDVAIVKLDDPGPWPASPMADDSPLEPGVWCLATGHSGGYSEQRPAVVRLGRLIDVNDDFLESDCPLVGGDSGGPLFDMQGRVIGIHSRIGPTVNRNFHAPVSIYRNHWDEVVNAKPPTPTDAESPNSPKLVPDSSPTPAARTAMLGLFAEDVLRGCRVTEVVTDQPADNGGIQLDDVILKVDGVTILGFNHLRALIRQREPGDKIVLTINRDDQEINKEVVLGALETSS